MLKKSSGTARVWPSRYLHAHPCLAHQVFDLPTLAGSHLPRSHRCLWLADTALIALLTNCSSPGLRSCKKLPELVFLLFLGQ